MLFIVLFSLLGTGILSLILMYALGANRVKETHINIETQGLKGDVDILQITDLHFYGWMPRTRLRSLIRCVKDSILRKVPDIIILTGDFIDHDTGIDLLDELLEILESRHGIYGVLGNHDFRQYNFLHIFYPLFYKIEGVKTDLKSLKHKLGKYSVEMLDHASKDVTINGNRIEIIGIDPRTFNNPDLAQWTRLEKNSYKLVLSHYPDAMQNLHDKIDLMFSGHTHGGQITLFGWPLITKTALARRYVYGLTHWGKSQLYVSRGCGVSHYMPFRLFSPAEINRIILRGK